MDEAHQNLLWTRFKSGDDDALSKLYMEYAHQLYSYGLKISNDEALVNDCIQDVFIQLIHKRKKIQITSRIQIYLFKSLRNKLFEENRSKNRKSNLIEKISDKSSEPEPNVEQILINSEAERDLKNRIGKLIEGLPLRQKEIIFLKYTEDLNYDEIAELFNTPLSSTTGVVF